MSAGARVARWLAGRWRQSLVFSMTIIGLAAVALVAVVVAQVVGREMRSDALGRAEATASLVARSSFAPRLPREGRPLARQDIRELDAQVSAARASQPGTEVELRGPDGRVLYQSAGVAPGQRATLGAAGTSVVGHGSARRVRTLLPVRRGRGGRPAAYLRVEAPYGPIASDIESRTRRLDLVLALTALAVYLLALPAMLKASRAVKAQYDPRRLQLAHDVRRGIKAGEFSLAFQPIVNSGSHELRSVETLVRWNDPQRGSVSPALFIPQLEHTDAIWDLSEHIFNMAFKQCCDWRHAGAYIPVAINVSGAVLLDRRLIPMIRDLTDRYGCPPDSIELEITEGALVQDPSEATRVLERIAEMGLRVIAIDDFGTGYSSLARLHELPVDTLKIDQSFVRRMDSDGDSAIVRSVIDLAHALRMDVIAEGVETEQSANALHELGAEYLQGYWFSKPMPADDVLGWLGITPGIPFTPSPRPAETLA